MTESFASLKNQVANALNAVTSLTLPAMTYGAGDVLLLFVMHRGSMTTPSGWTLVQKAGPAVGDATAQAVSVFSKLEASGGSVTLSVTQAASGRLAAILLRLADVDSVTARGDLVFAGSHNTATPFACTAKGVDRVVIRGISQVNGSGPANWTCSNSTTRIASPDAGGESKRLGVLIDDIPSTTFNLIAPSGFADYVTLAAVELVGKSGGASVPTTGQTWPRSA